MLPENLATYTGNPCAYVRWLDDSQEFYIGKAKNLRRRYGFRELAQIIYFEEYETEIEAVVAELRLIEEFTISASWPLKNVHGVDKPVNATQIAIARMAGPRQKTLALLNSQPDKKFVADEVAATLGIARKHAYRLLNMMAKRGDIKRETRGVYQAN